MIRFFLFLSLGFPQLKTSFGSGNIPGEKNMLFIAIVAMECVVVVMQFPSFYIHIKVNTKWKEMQ
jgi:hypothetical protein